MCGIVGMAGNLSTQARLKGFRDLLDFCQVRGRDATGVIKVNVDQTAYTWVKRVGPPAFLFETRSYDEDIERTDASVLIGHCRAKTIGENINKNAHPFDFPEKGICGVHNGTLRNHHKLDTHSYGKVDSEVLYGHLALNGPEETFPVLDGAYACVWWDDKEKTLNFIRNNERPLYLTWSKDAKMMFWASETLFLHSLRRHGIEFWDGDDDKNVFVELPPHSLWSFTVDARASGDKKAFHMKPVKKLEPRSRPTTPVYSHGLYNSNKWSQNEHGVYQRDIEKAADNKGGLVPDPFPQTKGGTSEEAQKEPNIQLSNVKFLTNSAKNSDGSMPPKSGTKSNRAIISLPTTPLKTLPSKPSEKQSAGSSCSVLELPNAASRQSARKPAVEFRRAAGILFITDNRNSAEYSIHSLRARTGGSCSFCKTPITEVTEVVAFINDHTFLCSHCNTGEVPEIVASNG